MAIETRTFQVRTKGFCDVVDLSPKLNLALGKTDLKNGYVLVHSPGATCGMTTIEYEPGVVKDLKDFFNKIIPEDVYYAHHETWHDGNGFSHVRSALLKSNFIFPLVNGEMILGTWQQVVLVDFDNKKRTRTVYVQVNGE